MRLAILIVSLLSFVQLSFASALEDANAAYQRGERAEDAVDRGKAFNEALELYSSVEGYHPKLYYNIANCYYQLGQYGISIWYYNQAKKLLPRNEMINSNLLKAQETAGVQESSMEPILDNIFYFQRKLNKTEQRTILSILIILTLLLASISLWTRINSIKYTAVGFSVALAILGTSSFLNFAISGTRAVLISSTVLRCDKGDYYQVVDPKPEFSGQKVKILEAKKESEWLKVKAPSGLIGYIHKDKARII